MPRLSPSSGPSKSFRPLALEPLEQRSLLYAGALQMPVLDALDAHIAVAASSKPALLSNAKADAAVSAAVKGGARSLAIVGDDAYENNDSFYQPANLGTLPAAKIINNLVMNDSADWYKFTMNARGTSSDFVKIQFTHALGDLDLALYNASGRLVGSSQGVTNYEQISLNSLAAGTYVVAVYGYRGVHNPSYTLTIDPGSTAPVPAPTPTPTPAPTPTPTPTPTPSGFHIDLNFQGLTTTEQAIFQQAARRWEQVITGDLPNVTYNGRVVDDLLIDADATSIDGAGGILGQAGPDRFRSGTMFPYHGSMDFDTADLAQMEARGSLLSVIEHEIGHILGIGTIWENKGLLTGAGTSNPRFIGQQATAEYNTIFGVHENGVPVESTGGQGTADSHWRESVLSNELMTGWAGPGTQLPLSRITVASLADLGYQVNLSAADAYSRPGSELRATSTTTSSTSFGSGLAALESYNQQVHQRTDRALHHWESNVDALMESWS